tara:strand:+ start:1179 stop:1583 length:405 start_codon:yes stop_codon:yes gene_type:complete
MNNTFNPDRFNLSFNIPDLDNIRLELSSKLKFCYASKHKNYTKEYIKKPFITDSRFISEEERNKFIQEDLDYIKELIEFYKKTEITTIFYNLDDDINKNSEYSEDDNDNEKYYSSESEDEFYSTVNEEYLHKFG